MSPDDSTHNRRCQNYMVLVMMSLIQHISCHHFHYAATIQDHATPKKDKFRTQKPTVQHSRKQKCRISNLDVHGKHQ